MAQRLLHPRADRGGQGAEGSADDERFPLDDGQNPSVPGQRR